MELPDNVTLRVKDTNINPVELEEAYDKQITALEDNSFEDFVDALQIDSPRKRELKVKWDRAADDSLEGLIYFCWCNTGNAPLSLFSYIADCNGVWSCVSQMKTFANREYNFDTEHSEFISLMEELNNDMKESSAALELSDIYKFKTWQLRLRREMAA